MRLEHVFTEYRAYRIPGLILTKKGTLLAYYECRKETTSDWSSIDLKVMRSEDDGDTWTTVCIIDGGSDTLNNPVMIADGDTVHFLYCKNYREILYRCSDDDGKSFSAAERKEEIGQAMTRPYTVIALGPGHGISHKGKLIIPMWFANNPEDLTAHRPSWISTVYSEDSGNTWKVGEIIGEELFIHPSECALAVMGDGRVLNSIRNENPEFLRGLAVSDNGYEGWREVRLSDALPDPICQGSMASLGNAVYHINCVSQEKKERTGLTLKISRDGFCSFESILIDEVGGYSDVAVSEDWIYILYERNVEEDGLYFCRLPRCEI